MMGGQAGASGHFVIGDGAQIAAQTGVHREVPAGAVYGGISRHRGASLAARVDRAWPVLPELFRRLRRVEKALGVSARRGRRGLSAPFAPRGRAAILRPRRCACPMKIALDQIRETPRALTYVEDVDGAQPRARARRAATTGWPRTSRSTYRYHRAGLDVFFDGVGARRGAGRLRALSRRVRLPPRRAACASC